MGDLACVTADRISFSAAISACEKGGQWRRALLLLNDIGLACVTADSISFSAAISACEKDGQWHHASLLLEDMGLACMPIDAIALNGAMSARAGACIVGACSATKKAADGA